MMYDAKKAFQKLCLGHTSSKVKELRLKANDLSHKGQGQVDAILSSMWVEVKDIVLRKVQHWRTVQPSRFRRDAVVVLVI